MSNRSAHRTVYELTEDADHASAAVAFRAGLIVLRPVIEEVVIEIISDDPWPDHLAAPLELLRMMAGDQHPLDALHPALEATIATHDEDGFAAALSCSPYTTLIYGLDHDGRIIYEGNDCGTQLWMSLTFNEYANVLHYLTAHRATRDALTPRSP
jgi:hypothetical protein